MKINFSNLGKIKEANLELADFTLIVGDNSLGKTILLESYALYSNVMKELQNDFCKWKYIYDVELEIHELVEECRDELHRETSIATIKYKTKNQKSLNELLDKYKEKYLYLLKSNILNDSDSETNVAITYNNVDLNKFPNEISIRKNPRFIKATLQSDLVRANIRIPIPIPKFESEENVKELVLERLKSRIELHLNKTYFNQLCGIEEIVFFPSERNLYKTNAYRKSAEFIEDSFSQIEKDSEMRYSESLFVKNYFEYLDYLDFVEEIDLDDEKNDLYEVICKALGGKPNYEDGIVNSIQQKNGIIPQKLFSTKQNRLLPYLMLCTYVISRKDRIIIEEPEAHMSLKSMFELVEMTEHLLKENKLIITSHSDVFVTLLNNLIKKNQINTKVYELINEGASSYLKEVLPGDYGYELSFMADQLIKLNNQTLEIFKDVIESGE